MNQVDEAQFKNFTNMVLQDMRSSGPLRLSSNSKQSTAFRMSKFKGSLDQISPVNKNKTTIRANRNFFDKNKGIMTNRNFGGKFFEQPLSPGSRELNTANEP